MERWGQLFWRLGTGVWLGSIFFLFAAIAPNVFRILPGVDAGRLVDTIFPIYYAIGLVFGGLALIGALMRLGMARDRNRWVLVGIGLANMLLVLWADHILVVMNRLAANSLQFRSLHERSVVISVVVFLVVLFGMIWEALWL
ncbi:MAG: DUF4149 domain-containing protein [Firmicutes bacterium]|nr:DUF4149 domain-containing protein [Bacillota bacterium]